jgi:hypothetical protein
MEDGRGKKEDGRRLMDEVRMGKVWWCGENVVTLTASKVLTLEKAQINLAFCSLNRTFVE